MYRHTRLKAIYQNCQKYTLTSKYLLFSKFNLDIKYVTERSCTYLIQKGVDQI